MFLKGGVLRNSKKIYALFAAILLLVTSTPIVSFAATGEVDHNAQYFKDHGYTVIDGSSIDADPANSSIGETDPISGAVIPVQPPSGGFSVVKAYNTLQSDANAVVIPDQATADYLLYLLKQNQASIKSNYYQLVADYTFFSQQYAAFKADPSTNDTFTNANGATTMKFETTGGFVSIAESWFQNVKNDPWVLAWPINDGATVVAAVFTNQIKPRVDNSQNSVTYFQTMQTERTALDAAIANVHALLYVFHSKKSDGTYWRDSDDHLYVYDAANGKSNPSDPNLSNTIFTYDLSSVYSNFSDFLKAYAPYEVNGAIAQPIDAIGMLSSTAQQNNGANLNATRCGGHSATSFLNFLDLTYDFCVVVDTVSQFSDTLLLSAAQLLATTAGINGATASLSIPTKTSYHPTNSAYVVPQSNIWGSILPVEVSTPFQSIMVDDKSSIGKTVDSTAKIVNVLLDGLLVITFLVVAVTNILQIQTNTFGIRKLIPMLIVGFILSQGSFFMIRAALEGVGEASSGILSLAKSDVNTDTGNIFQNYVEAISDVRGAGGSQCLTDSTPDQGCGGDDANSHVDNGRVFQQAILNLFVIAGAIVLFILGFLFGARVFVFTIAVPLAPLAVICRFIPPLGFLWTRWWKTVSSWIIMPLPVMLLLVLSSIYFKSANSVETKDGVGLFGYLIDYAAGMVFLIAAIKLPFSLAGEAKGFLDRYNALGKMAYNKSIGAGIKYAGSEAKHEGLKRLWLSPGGDYLRAREQKKAQRKEELELASKGIVANPGRQKRTMELETLKAQKQAGSEKNQKRVSLRISQLESEDASSITDFEAKQKDLKDEYDLATTTPERKLEIEAKRAEEVKNFNAAKTKRDSEIATLAKQRRFGDATFLASVEAKIANLEKNNAGDWREKRNRRTFEHEILHQKEHELRTGSVDTAKANAELELASGSHEYKEAIELAELAKQEASRSSEDVKLKNRSYVANAESAPPELRPVLKQQRLRDQFLSQIKAKTFQDEADQARRDYSYNILLNSEGIIPAEDDTLRPEFDAAIYDVSSAVGERVGKTALVVDLSRPEVKRVVDPTYKPKTVEELEFRRKTIAYLITRMDSLNSNLDSVRLVEIYEDLKKATSDPGDITAITKAIDDTRGEEDRTEKAKAIREVVSNTNLGKRITQMKSKPANEFFGDTTSTP